MCTWNWYYPGQKECSIEYEDCEECFLRYKIMTCVGDIKWQWDKLITEGKCIPPTHHLGKREPRPWAEQLEATFHALFPLERVFSESFFIKVCNKKKKKELLHL